MSKHKDLFPELVVQFIENLQDAACRLLRIPNDDSFWRTAPHTQNFFDALRHFLDNQIRVDPENETFATARIGLMVLESMNPTFGGQRWVPIVAKEPRNIRWMIESALQVHLSSGKDETDELVKTLSSIKSRMPDFQDILVGLKDSEDVDVAKMSGVALAVMRGDRLPSLW